MSKDHHLKVLYPISSDPEKKKGPCPDGTTLSTNTTGKLSAQESDEACLGLGGSTFWGDVDHVVVGAFFKFNS